MAPLTLTILGAGPAAPNPGGACSGYLLRQAESAVLMDCGSGIAGRIAQHVPVSALQGVAISHLHPDHYFDLVPLYYMRRFGDPPTPDLPARLPVAPVAKTPPEPERSKPPPRQTVRQRPQSRPRCPVC